MYNVLNAICTIPFRLASHGFASDVMWFKISLVGHSKVIKQGDLRKGCGTKVTVDEHCTLSLSRFLRTKYISFELHEITVVSSTRN
jgi:hypothetical protein